jgi:hypothetical protein
MSNEAASPEAAPFQKHEIIKEDGRLLIFYAFDEDGPAEPSNRPEEAERV